MRRARTGMLLLLSPFVACAALAQEPKPTEPPPTSDPIPDLDEMLGLPSQKKTPPPPAEGEAPATTDPAALDTDQLELERKLTAKELAEKFDEAVRQMGETADRIQKIGDVGIATQRLHEEILRKLDVLIKQSNSGSPSSSGSSEQQQESEASRAAQQRRQRGNDPNQQAGAGDNRGERLPPAMTPAERQARLDTARAAWGSLPDRVRDSLLEGSSDYFSALYEAMTEAYYKKIAEEAKE